MHLKLSRKEQLKEQQKQVVIWLAKLQKHRELHHWIVQIQLQMKQKILSMIKKYLKKDIYLQKKGRNYWWSKINVMVY